MVFGALLSAQDGVQIESSWDCAYEGYLAHSASTHHYRMLKKWASVDRKGVYGLMGHVQRNRDVENLLGDAEYAEAADVVSSSAADQLRKRKFQDDRGKAHVMLVKQGSCKGSCNVGQRFSLVVFRDFLKKSASLYHRLIEIVILHTKFLQMKICKFLS